MRRVKSGEETPGRTREEIQLMRFQVWPPQNSPPKAQPWTLRRFGPFIAMVEVVILAGVGIVDAAGPLRPFRLHVDQDALAAVDGSAAEIGAALLDANVALVLFGLPHAERRVRDLHRRGDRRSRDRGGRRRCGNGGRDGRRRRQWRSRGQPFRLRCGDCCNGSGRRNRSGAGNRCRRRRGRCRYSRRNGRGRRSGIVIVVLLRTRNPSS